MSKARDLLPNAVLADIDAGNKMAAIKRLRELGGVNLAEAKSMVEAASPASQVVRAPRPALGRLAGMLVTAALKGDKEEAMKSLREQVQRMAAERGEATRAATPATSGAKPARTTVFHHHHEAPRSRPGLSPGEVPRAGGAVGVAMVVLVGIVVAYTLLAE